MLKLIDKTCLNCDSRHQFLVDLNKYIEWKDGKPIQFCFPDLTVAQRELMISGLCGDCFDKIFKEENEETSQIQSR